MHLHYTKVILMDRFEIIYPYDFTVLIVDDDIEILEQYKHILKENHYGEVLTATSGEEAIEIVKKQSIDILLIDYFMPNMNGEETIDKIREFNSEIVIIVQTGFAGDKSAKELLQFTKIQGYYDKSEDISKLLLCLAVGMRVSAQVKQIKEMVEELNTANNSLNSMMQNQEWMIERIRLASLGQRMGSIFHDLATPKFCMSSINCFILDMINELEEKINQDNLPKDEIIKIIEEIRDHCNDASKHLQFISDVMETVKEQSRQEKVARWQKFTLDKVIEKIEFFVKADTRKNCCCFKTDNKVTSEVYFYGSEINLIQVILNLVGNSAQAYSVEGGKIDFVISQNEDNIIFSVVDYAGGIQKEIQDKILKEMVSTKGDHGNGIGLYSSNLIIKDYYKGNMWFECEDGIGTKFFVSIPYKAKQV